MRRVLLVSLLSLAVAGCGGSFRSGTFDSSPEQPSGGYARLRAAMPALDAWYADHGTYAGVTASALRTRYDSGLHDVRVVSADARAYCLEATQGDTTLSMRGPGGHVILGPC